MDTDFKRTDDWIKLVLTTLVGLSIYNIHGCGLNSGNLAIIGIPVYLLSSHKRRRHLRMLCRDIKCLIRLLRIALFIKKIQKNKVTIPKKFKEICDENPNKIMLQFEDQTWTFQEMDEFSNKVGNFFASKGVREGDNLALFMDTRIEYVGFWLGLQKIGAAVSLINSNLRGSSLAHNLQAVPIRGIIYGPEVQSALDEVMSSVKVPIYAYEGKNNKKSTFSKSAVDLESALEKITSSAPSVPDTNDTSTALYVFTSGTTGMPKAAVITHGRYIAMAMASTIYIRMKADDVVYVPLPLYHSNGGVLGIGQALVAGLSVTLRKKFSASNFWKDCIRYHCTAFIYIGELCRYLLAQPSRPEDQQHKVRLMLGNGLRPLIWENFVTRFGIKQVAECYGSSEGIGSLMNTEGKVGAVGHIPLLWPTIVPVHLVKVDPDTENPVRDTKGRCIPVTKPGTPGMHISKIINNRVGQDFEGYADRAATSSKVIRDVFQEGDMYYVSGDIFIMDDEKFVYFQDRTGDTFRWRGENVSTAEVEQIISDVIGLKDAAVYGVGIPGVEGNACMAAILDEEAKLNLSKFNQDISKRLPKYARPLFIRLLKKFELTETFKIKKKQLKEEAYNPNIVKDKLYVYDGKLDEYLEITENIYKAIVNGEIIF